MRRHFRDRSDAGRRLAEALAGTELGGAVVLALPRGGVPVGHEVARHLGAPLDVFVVRKLGVPGQEELAMGAIASGGTRVVNREVVELLGIGAAEMEEVAEREHRELERREREYRGNRSFLDVTDRTVVLVDDGIATGSTMLAAIRALRALGVVRIVVAAPVAPRSVVSRLKAEADDVVCAIEADWLNGISVWYDDFEQTTDAEVRTLLAESRRVPEALHADTGKRGGLVEAEVTIEAAGVQLRGDLALPEPRRGVVVFAHGSGSSRRSPRNRRVAALLQEAGLATLLVDLLTEDEEEIDRRTRHLRFDIPLLSDRLVDLTDWVTEEPRLAGLDPGLFGASTGAAAALLAAARRPASVAAVVSRGGRPDLAAMVLPQVRCPVLLIVGELDREVLGMNREALALLRGEKRLEVIPGATHLFEEPGALDTVALLARDWYLTHGRAPGAAREPHRTGGDKA